MEKDLKAAVQLAHYFGMRDRHVVIRIRNGGVTVKFYNENDDGILAVILSYTDATIMVWESDAFILSNTDRLLKASGYQVEVKHAAA